MRAVAGTRTLLILTYRPEYAAEVLRGSHCEQLALRPLGPRAVRELLGSLLGQDRSLDGLPELIAARAVGNPFFCEELVAALAESGNLVGERGSYRLGRTLEEVVLPATVQATLAARIDRLREREKGLLQVASVIGYELEEAVLRAISGLSDSELNDALGSLVSAELLVERMGESGVAYAFRHPLTQEVAYRSQLSDRRRHVHRQVAVAIERLYPERLDELAALAAKHYEAAGDQLAAARFTSRAAAWVGASDISQALSHWRKVGELTVASRLSRDHGLALGACPGSWITDGVLASQRKRRGHTTSGVATLAQKSPDRTPLFMLVAAYAGVCMMAGNLKKQAELADEVDRLSIEIGDPDLRMVVLPALVYTRTMQGRMGESLSFADEGIALAGENHALGGRAWCVCLPLRVLPALEGPDTLLHGASGGVGEHV